MIWPMAGPAHTIRMLKGRARDGTSLEDNARLASGGCGVVVGVGARLGTEFDGREITDPHRALPGAVLITYAPANPPGPRPGLVAVMVLLTLAGAREPDAVAVWPGLDHAWPEIVRTSVLFAARYHGRFAR